MFYGKVILNSECVETEPSSHIQQATRTHMASFQCQTGKRLNSQRAEPFRNQISAGRKEIFLPQYCKRKDSYYWCQMIDIVFIARECIFIQYTAIITIYLFGI